LSREAAATARRQREARIAQALPDRAVALLGYPVAALDLEDSSGRWLRIAPEGAVMPANGESAGAGPNLPTRDP
jgi:hypothetical protein